MKSVSILILYMAIQSNAVSQKNFVYYLDKNLKSTSKKEALIQGIATKEKEKNTVREYMVLISDPTSYLALPITPIPASILLRAYINLST